MKYDRLHFRLDKNVLTLVQYVLPSTAPCGGDCDTFAGVLRIFYWPTPTISGMATAVTDAEGKLSMSSTPVSPSKSGIQLAWY